MNNGRDRTPVGRSVFKTGRGGQAVPGGFDSHSLPPRLDGPSIRPRCGLLRTNGYYPLCGLLRTNGFSPFMGCAPTHHERKFPVRPE